MFSSHTSSISVILVNIFVVFPVIILALDFQLSRLPHILCVILALIFTGLIVNLLQLDRKRGRTLGLFGGLWFSLIQINELIFAMLFRTGMQYRINGAYVSADDIINRWPRTLISLPLIICFSTLIFWIFESFLNLNPSRRR